MIAIITELISDHGPVAGMLILALATCVVLYRKNDKQIDTENTRLVDRVDAQDLLITKQGHTIMFLTSLINFAELTPDERARAEREIME